jgi:hypothetical protein
MNSVQERRLVKQQRAHIVAQRWQNWRYFVCNKLVYLLVNLSTSSSAPLTPARSSKS